MFNEDSFADEFKNTIDWMCNEGLSLKVFKTNKDGLGKDPNYEPAFRTLVELVVTNSWFFRKPKAFEEKITAFTYEHGPQFLTAEAHVDLVDLTSGLAPRNIANRAKQSLSPLTRYGSIKEFVDNLYSLAKDGKREVCF